MRIFSHIFAIVSLAVAASGVLSCENGGTVDSGSVSLTISGEAALGKAGGQAHVRVESNSPWEAALADDEAGEWMSFAPGRGSAGGTDILIVATANEGGVRTADIIFTARDAEGREATETLTVRQSGTTLEVSPGALEFEHGGGNKTFAVSTDAASWRVDPAEQVDWCTATKSGDNVSVEVEQNYGEAREVVLTVTAGGATENVTVRQTTLDRTLYYLDGEVVKLQNAATGDGVDLVLMGDGYTTADMTRSGGKYESAMREAADHFFSIYPISAHEGKFNVWMVVATSAESGITTPDGKKKTRFEAVWAGPGSTQLNCNKTTVELYAEKAAVETGKPIGSMTVVVPLNNFDRRAGTSWPRKDGFSISLVPTGASYFRPMVIHEACGHGFGRLADEYYSGDGTIPTQYIAQVLDAHSSGLYLNIDVECGGDASKSLWKGFVGNPKYPMVGAFEGAFQFAKGVWRPEEKKNCMDNETIYYFDAPSRWIMVNRAYELAGIPYTFEQFLAEDVVPEYPSGR